MEATGGNTGIALAFVAAIRGYWLILTMPQAMSKERVALLRHLGAEVVLTPGILITDAVARAEPMVQEVPGAIMLDQFRNGANPEIHRRTTALEIWEDTAGVVDVFVCAVGAGGTITGVGEVLKERNPSIRVIGVEPANAAMLSGGRARNHQIPGIGVGFIPEGLNRSILDEVIAATDEDAFCMCASAGARRRHSGASAGSRPEAAGSTIVVILPETGERYITTALFD